MTFTKRTHHFVPQFWLKRFSDSKNRIFARGPAGVYQVSSKNIMQQDWLYTVFDKNWNPSDSLEDSLSKLECQAAPLLNKLCDPNTAPIASDRIALCDFLALQACRHPDILNRGYRRSRELGKCFAEVHSFNGFEAFMKELAQFGITPDEAKPIYKNLLKASTEQLRLELEELNKMSAQNPQLPEQDALRAMPVISNSFRLMDFTLLDAPASNVFVLSDTPLPQDNLIKGFSVPLSSHVAIIARPSLSPNQATAINRRFASVEEVDAINKVQWDNALRIAIGSDKTVLSKL